MKITVRPEWSIIRVAHLENILLTRAIPDFPSSMELWHSYQFALRMSETDFFLKNRFSAVIIIFRDANTLISKTEVTVGVIAGVTPDGITHTWENPINCENTFTGIVYRATWRG